MASVNKVIIVGNMGADPDVKNFNDGSKIVSISVATSERWTDKMTGEQREKTEWHRVIFNNRLADIAEQYLRKGSQVYIEGSLSTRKWTDKDGIERYLTEIRAFSMQMLGNKNNNNGGNFDSYPTRPYNNNQGYQNNQSHQSNQGYQDSHSHQGYQGNQAYQNTQGNHFDHPNNHQDRYNQGYGNGNYNNPNLQPTNPQPQNNPMPSNNQNSFGNPSSSTPSQKTPIDDDMPF